MMNFYIDFEATQFSQFIISIGCVADNGNTFNTLVKPVNNEKVNPFITNLTGITNEALIKAPSADEAFKSFFNYICENCALDNSIPVYCCYGNTDKTFLSRTIKYMKDIQSITIAASIQALLVDYATIVKNYFDSNPIALKKVYALLQEEEVIQRHDALDDACMLQEVAQKLNTLEKNSFPKLEVKTPIVKQRVPEEVLGWHNITKWDAVTDGNQESWEIRVIAGPHIRYFASINSAALWAITYIIQGKSPKRKKDIDCVANNINNAIKSKTSYGRMRWEKNSAV